MKKSRIIFIFAVVLILACLLTACNGRSAKFSEVYKDHKYDDKTPTYTKMSKIDTDAELVRLEGNLALFQSSILVNGVDSENIRYSVYNMKTMQFIASVDETEEYQIKDFSVVAIKDGYVFTVHYEIYENDISEWNFYTDLYNENGKRIDTAKGNVNAVFSSALNMVHFGDFYFTIDDEGNAECYDPGTNSIPNITQTQGKYHYSVNTNNVLVYDEEFKLIGECNAPSYAYSFTNEFFHILENGNILIQYFTSLPQDEDEYDVLLGDDENLEKVKLVSKIYNVKTNSTKKIKSNFIIQEIGTEDALERLGLSKIGKNIALALEIVDKRIDYSENNMKIVSVTNGGKVDLVLNDMFVAQGISTPYLISDKHYFYMDATDNMYIVNHKGKNIGRITTATAINESYYILDGKIYNHDCEEVFDMEDGNYQLVKQYDNCYILKTEDDENYSSYYLFANDKLTYITFTGQDYDEKILVTNYGRFFYTVKADGKNSVYEFYNDRGELIESITANGRVFAAQSADVDGAIIYFVNENSNKSDYYILTV